jgi:hypothetical protein
MNNIKMSDKNFDIVVYHSPRFDRTESAFVAKLYNPNIKFVYSKVVIILHFLFINIKIKIYYLFIYVPLLLI